SLLKTIPGVVPAHFVVIQTQRAWTNRQARISRLKTSARLVEQIAAARDLKINLGAGLTAYEGWISVEFTEVDAADDRDWWRYFVPNTVSNVLSEHVWEHMTAEHGLAAARCVHKYLQEGGCFRVAVPDRNHPSPEYHDDCKPDPFILGHKEFYDKNQMVDLLMSAGFSKVTPIEWWDSSGKFNKMPWGDERGHVNRSAHNEPLNAGGNLVYTSLIVDAFK